MFEPAVMHPFPRGQTINLHPWKHNEVPVLLGAALREKSAIVVLHLGRPPIETADRARLAIASHFEAGRGTYLVRDYQTGLSRGGAIIAQGTSSMVSPIKILPELERRVLNVKIVHRPSPERFPLQPESFRKHLLSDADRSNSTVISTQSWEAMRDWMSNEVGEEHAMTADWDNRWRTGATVEEVLEEAHLSPDRLLKGIEHFVKERDQRLSQLEARIKAARG
ncbi:MAG: hypothetical protein ABSF61_12295 [Anaerolineales bacterium]|jgi:transketolase